MMYNKDDVISCNHVSIAYVGEVAVKDVSFSIPAGGSMIALVGPNGAGKSSLLKALVGVVRPYFGTVRFWGETFSRVRSKIAYIPQRSSIDLNFPITVEEIVSMGSYNRLGLWRSATENDKKACCDCLKKVGLLELSNTCLSSLSGGQQQRAFIGRALMQDADLYILDEPFVGVDVVSLSKILSILKELVHKKKTVLVVHHDLNSVSDHFDSVMFINKRLIAFGKTSDVFTDKNINFAYGGIPRLIDEAEKACSDMSKGIYKG